MINNKKLYLLCLFLITLMTGCGGGGGADTQTAVEVDLSDLESGLEQRPVNTSCRITTRPPKTTRLELQRAFPNIVVDFPVAMLQAPADSTRWFVLDKTGRIVSFTNDSQVSETSLVVDLRDRVDFTGEGGLLGMAFHPDFANNNEVFLYYTRTGSPLISYVSRFRSSDGGVTFDPDSEQVLLTVAQPNIMHMGGDMRFGSDGYLYISLGDAGIAEFDPGGSAQNTDDLLGSLLRIDVDGGTPYAIPADNPFAGPLHQGEGRPEIFAWGFRNPWRWTFDRETGDIWLGDVGERLWEEVNRVEKGGNYGWSIIEATHCTDVMSEACNNPELIDPVFKYSHDQGCAVIGGYVYRGSAIPGLQGTYVYSDFCGGWVKGLLFDNQGNATQQLLAQGNGIGPSAFAEDHNGELYLLDVSGAVIYQLREAADNSVNNNFPTQLSQTGCIDPQNPQQPAQGLISYDVNAPFWSDGADKQRWIALPDGLTIERKSDGQWQFPIGSVIMKQFSKTGQPFETRLLVRHEDGFWAGYSYEWNDAGTDASYIAGGKIKTLADGQQWVYPGSAECLRCHTAASHFTLGLETAQLNGDKLYPGSGRIANQLATYHHIGLFSQPLKARPEHSPRLADLLNQDSDVGQRARAYLHSNCAQCHQPGGPTGRAMDLRFTTALADMNICNVVPQGTHLDIADARLIAPGRSESSVLLARMNRRDLQRMPPLASLAVDEEGVELITEWIAGLQDCQ